MYGLSTESREDGSFSFPVFDAGEAYIVRVNWLDEWYSREGVMPGTTNVDIVVPELGRLLLRVLDARTKEPIPRFSVGWRCSGDLRFRDTDLNSGNPSDPAGWFETRLPVGRLDLIFHARFWGYRPTVVSDVLVTATIEATRLDVEVEEGTRAIFVLAPGQEPLPADHSLLLLEPEVWEEVRLEREADRIREIAFGRFPSNSFFQCRLRFDSTRTAVMKGLCPGPYHLKAVPDDIEISPGRVEVNEADRDPIALSWTWK